MAEKQTATLRGRPLPALDFVGRRSFGLTKLHSSCLVQGQNRLGRSDAARINRP